MLEKKLENIIELSDEQLVILVKKNNQEALEEIIKRYEKKIYNFIFRFTNGSSEAADLAQETLIKAWQNINKFKSENKYKTWIFTIAKNTCIDFFRKKQPLVFSDLINDESEESIALDIVDPLPLASEIVERADIALMLENALAKINPQYRLVLLLYYVDSFNLAEIANILQKSSNTVKSRYRRGLIRLKELIEMDK